MPETLPAAKLSLSFAKLVATPTETAWSQAYNAGNLFVCLSLTIEEANEEISLHVLGKELFNVLQSEFFTLQEKNTAHIKTALQTSLTDVPPHVTACLTLAFFKDTTLLVFIAGSGKIVMKRGEKIGILLAKQDSDKEILSASGFIDNSDTLILETGQFADNIQQQSVIQALELELPNDIVEALSPEMHKVDNGAQAAIVISYRGASAPPAEAFDVDEEQGEEQADEPTLGSLYTENVAEEPTAYEPPQEHKKRPTLHLNLPHIPALLRLSHRRKLFLNIALILAVLLLLSIFFTFKKYNDDKEQALFQSIYPQAQQYYSQGKGLESVNAQLSEDNFHKAESLLKNGQTKFGKGSKDYQQISDLLAQVENSLHGNVSGQSAHTTAVQPEAHSLLAVEQAKSDGLAFGQDTNDIYMITKKAITTLSQSDGASKDIIKNNSDWSTPVAVVPYQGNVYVLDPKKGVLKFVASGNGFGKTAYFKGTAPDLSPATSMAIDGSVWLLFKDGTIMQYTKGVSNGLQVSGLVKPLNNPTKIVTDITMESIYVMDQGNSRIVQFDKNGKYQNAYSTPVISQAKDFVVSEKDKKIQILSGGKMWEMSL